LNQILKRQTSRSHYGSNSDCNRGNHANRYIIAEIESIIKCTLGKNITFSPQRCMNSRSTGHQSGMQTVTPQMRYTPRSAAHQTDMQTVSPQMRYISLPLHWIGGKHTNRYNCRVVLKLVWQNTVSYDFCVFDVICRENN
jgi:hypothetical protein